MYASAPCCFCLYASSTYPSLPSHYAPSRRNTLVTFKVSYKNQLKRNKKGLKFLVTLSGTFKSSSTAIN